MRKKCNNSRTVGLTGPGFLMCGVKYQIQIYCFLKEHVRLILLTSGSLKKCGFLEGNIDSRKIKQLPNHWWNGARLSDVRSWISNLNSLFSQEGCQANTLYVREPKNAKFCLENIARTKCNNSGTVCQTGPRLVKSRVKYQISKRMPG